MLTIKAGFIRIFTINLHIDLTALCTEKRKRIKDLSNARFEKK